MINTTVQTEGNSAINLYSLRKIIKQDFKLWRPEVGDPFGEKK